jgi:hypothetical protein
MGEEQSCGVEEISPQRTEFLREFPVASLAIDIITDDGVPEGTEMDADLVRASRFDFHFEKRETSEVLHHPVFRVCRSALRFARSHFRAGRRMTAHRQLDSPGVTLEFPVNEGHIGFLNFPILKLFAQPRVRNIILGDDEQARSLLVEAMHDTGPRCSPRIRKFLKVKKESMHDRPRTRSGPRMDHQSGRLFDDGQILVLEVDPKGNLFCRERRLIERVKVDFDRFPAPNPVSGFVLASFDQDCARTIQELNLRPGDIFEPPGKKDVETKSAIVRICQECH